MKLVLSKEDGDADVTLSLQVKNASELAEMVGHLDALRVYLRSRLSTMIEKSRSGQVVASQKAVPAKKAARSRGQA